MKIAIVYSSITGNTLMVANKIRESLSEYDLIYFGKVPKEKIEADLYIVGSWTNKGNANNDICEFLKKLNNKKIAYFGTAGYGKDPNYYETLFNRVKENIDSSNRILGCFYCQGKMSQAIRDRYVKLITENPNDANLKVSIENFDEALTHPDDIDLENARNWILSIVC